MFLSQVFDGLLLPIVLVFVMLLTRNRKLLGELVSGRALQTVGWLVTVLIGAISIGLVASEILGGG
jgi:Mn2+/Fe2+ NRAMP family transporter